MDCTPPENAKPKTRYECQYNRFLAWRKSKNTTGTSENIILAYLAERSSAVNPSSLWSEYSMINSMLKLHEDADISNYHIVKAFLKQNIKTKDYIPKKSKTLSEDQCFAFLREAPDEYYLMMKVVLIMGLYGACRRGEITNITLNDLKHYNDYLLVTIPKTKNSVLRKFVITNDGKENIDMLSLVKKYQALRPAQTPHNRLFIYYQMNKCTVTPVGKNTIGKIPLRIATYLKLEDPNSYTGHCFRRSSASHLANSGAKQNVFYNLRTETSAINTTNEIEVQNSSTTDTINTFNSVSNITIATEVQNSNVPNDEDMPLKRERLDEFEFQNVPDWDDDRFESESDIDFDLDETSMSDPNGACTNQLFPKVEKFEEQHNAANEISATADEDADKLFALPPNECQISATNVTFDRGPAPTATLDVLHVVNDEFHLFAVSVASQLRNMPLNTALIAQCKIQELMAGLRINPRNITDINSNKLL